MNNIQNLMILAQNGNSEAMVRLGFEFMSGKKIDKDYVTAYNYYIQAAELKNRDAMFNLGQLYLNGIKNSDLTYFLNPDTKIALTYFKKASDLGCLESMYFFAIESNKMGDLENCLKYLHLAAQNGFGKAQYELGIVYLNQMSDKEKAKYWLELAFNSGIYSAKSLLERM